MANAKLLTIAVFLIIILSLYNNEARITNDMVDTFFPSDSDSSQRWAILVAGSRGYQNYRHQADICHAWQLLTAKGVPKDNIVVFMFDDIAYNIMNPYPGVIRNFPSRDGFNVYKGVSKDYVGEDVTPDNLVSAFLGNSKPGGARVRGKIVDSGPNDFVFFYYSGHGDSQFLGFPLDDDTLTLETFRWMLEVKEDSLGFNQMLIYIEACKSGSMIEFLDDSWRIYATASANSTENSYGVYCGFPPYYTCLGDGYSVAWMEDSDVNDITQETIGMQYERVRARVLTQLQISHVVEYGDMGMKNSPLSVYHGPDPYELPTEEKESTTPTTATVRQDEAETYYLKEVIKRNGKGSDARVYAEKALADLISHQKHIDDSLRAIVQLLVNNGKVNVASQLFSRSPKATRDLKCLKALVASYQAHCGSLRKYGLKLTLFFANVCEAGVSPHQFARASSEVCTSTSVNPTYLAEPKFGFYEPHF